MERDLTKKQMVDLLNQLGQELAARGISGDIFIVGGAAIALAYDDRRLTRDIDAVFAPKDEIYDAAKKVAKENNLPDGWFNDAVKGLMPPNGIDPSVRLSFPGLNISIASPEYLLAMKVSSARLDRDVDDIKLLIKECGYTTPEQVLASVERTWGSQAKYVLQPKSRFLIESVFDEMKHEEQQIRHKHHGLTR